MKNTRATLDSFKVKPDEHGPLTSMTIKARLTGDQIAALYELLLVEEGALDVTIESKQPAFA